MKKKLKGYFAALAKVEKYAQAPKPIDEKQIQTLHSLVVSNGLGKSETITLS